MNSKQRFSITAQSLVLMTATWLIGCVNNPLITGDVPNNQEFIIADLPINDISVEILESLPIQVHIVVSGSLSDACTTINEITQQRDGNAINVHITTKRPKDEFCAQVIKEVEERIPLEGGFLPGRYKVIVNEVEKAFEIN